MKKMKRMKHVASEKSWVYIVMCALCLMSLMPIHGLAQTVGTNLRSWRTFYPMDRGQARGQRAGNPWVDSLGENSSIVAQLTWRLPSGLAGDPPWGANRPNLTFPGTVGAWPSIYPAHQPEYYMNWWCQEATSKVFFPAQHNCTDVSAYEELITEIPDVNGSPAAFLGLWAQGAQSSYTVNYDTAVCDLLSHNDPAVDMALSDLSRMRPLLYALPLAAGSTFFAPAACRVTFQNSYTRTRAAIIDYGKEYIATSVFADFWTAHGHVVGALNYAYSGPGGTAPTCLPVPPRCSNGQLPGGNPDCSLVASTDSSQGFGACVTYIEPYYMVDSGNALVNGMTSWGLGMTYNSSGNGLNNVVWDTDWGRKGYVNSPPPPQFSFDSCTFGPGGNMSWLSCQ
jgi:hypothetical protein